jgi:DNA mismatch repair protein MutL
MPKVFVLPDHIASQIAAGEVVERPSSVVKELVENAIDAGATQIDVAIGSNCRDIRVADNGCGMAAEDAVLAFQRHATSKIRSADDLWTLTSLGFRGEALPSIASVSKAVCTTRMRESMTGSRVDAADGKLTCVETGCAPGTIMEITDLFYNVPARLNFLKKGSTEFAHIEEIMQSLALAHPEIAFNLTNNGSNVLKTTGTGDLAQAMTEVGMFSHVKELCDIEYEDSRNGVRIRGKVARPIHFRGDRKGIHSMVNKRPVRCHLTYKALEYAFSDLIPRGRHPFAVVSIEIDPKFVDVNIHPTKKEIKYSTGNDIYLTLQRALVNALRREREADNAEAASRVLPWQQAEPMSEEREEDAAPAPHEVHASRDRQISFRDRLVYVPPFKDTPARQLVAESESVSSIAVREREEEPEELQTSQKSVVQLPHDWRLAGYVHNTYIILETSEGMMMVEQHIAHERTLYERLLAAQENAGRITEQTQKLIVSAPLKLSPEQRDLLKEHANSLAKLGFDFEFDGDNAICSEVPLELAGSDYATVIQELADQLIIAGSANIELEATKSIACQAAIKNGMVLSEADIRKLLADWFATPRNDTCPHGRPICLKFAKDKLFQMFHPA